MTSLSLRLGPPCRGWCRLPFGPKSRLSLLLSTACCDGGGRRGSGRTVRVWCVGCGAYKKALFAAPPLRRTLTCGVLLLSWLRGFRRVGRYTKLLPTLRWEIARPCLMTGPAGITRLLTTRLCEPTWIVQLSSGGWSGVCRDQALQTLRGRAVLQRLRDIARVATQPETAVGHAVEEIPTRPPILYLTCGFLCRVLL